MTRRYLVAFAFTALASLALAKPNFTGQWKMDSSKSDFGQFPAPEKYDRKVTHDEPNIQINTAMVMGSRDVAYDVKYTTDGKETTNTTQGRESKGSAKWEGDVLVIESVRETPNGSFKSVERWTSVNGGKSIQVDAKISGGSFESGFKIHFDKQ
jgi:hypothetical protein